MPVIIALILRRLVMALVTGVAAATVQNITEGGFKALVAEIRDKEGVTEQDAWDIVKNILGDVLTQTGVSFALLSVKLPVAVVERLGLTSKGLAKTVLKGKAAQVATKLAANGGKAIAQGAFPSWMKIVSVPASAIWLISAVANIVEPGIYKPEQTNAVYKALGIPFQYPTQGASEKPGPFSSDSSVTFSDYFTALEKVGIKGINNTYAQQTQIFNRQKLADLVNAVYGDLVTQGKAPSVKDLIPKIAPYLIGGSGGNININSITTGNNANNTSGSNTGSSGTAGSAGANTSSLAVKVFTGIVSQGSLGSGLIFTERQDDLIESTEELRAAASNNVAPFLAALPSRVRYEIKVVSSIVTKDGFRKTGEARRIQTGTNKDGTPKYKNVVNKFAVMDLFLLTDKGNRTNISRIVLGPTDAVKFAVTEKQLGDIASVLPSLVTTQNITEITQITTPSGTQQISQSTPNVPVYQNPADEANDTGFRFYSFEVNGEVYYEVLPWVGNVPTGYTMITKQEYLDKELLLSTQSPNRWKQWFTEIRRKNPTAFTTGVSGYIIKDGVPFYMGNASGSGTAYSETVSGANSQQPGANASTLSEWYQSQGQSLPSLTDRAALYESMGLGQSVYYTGTAEQNTKLLNALKAK